MNLIATFELKLTTDTFTATSRIFLHGSIDIITSHRQSRGQQLVGHHILYLFCSTNNLKYLLKIPGTLDVLYVEPFSIFINGETKSTIFIV